MSNLRTSLENAESAYGERIEGMVVGQHDNADWSAPDNPDENVILSREAGLAKIDQDFDSGYGGADCYPLLAWTASRVFFVGEYDGTTGLAYVPRNPTACEPQFSGQSLAIDFIQRKTDAA